jgi:hypothetical protein
VSVSEQEHTDEERPVPSGELLQLRRNRYREARKAGMTFAESKMFADSDIDIGELRRRVKQHVPPDLLAKIIL